MFGETTDNSSQDLNIWVSFADVFAGLLLITMIGLGFLIYVRKEEDVKFSVDLLRVMNKSIETKKQLQAKLNVLLPNLPTEAEGSETEIVIPAGALFEQLSYDDFLTDQTKLALLSDIRKALKDTLDAAGNDRKFLRITIEGHTDSDPIGLSRMTKAIPTNWELSSRRATGVLRFFETGGLTAKDYNIVAMGLADTKPIAPNTPKEKWKNRRIVIRIEPDFDRLRQIH